MKSYRLLFLELVESMGHKSLSKPRVQICTYKEESLSMQCVKKGCFYHTCNWKPKALLSKVMETSELFYS